MIRSAPHSATLAALALIIAGCAGAPLAPTAEGRATVLPTDQVKWEPLNPARGDASPRAGTLWGDRKGRGPTGFLVRFKQGFASPPHIHNVTYRGVVIEGQVHNDDANAPSMWMPAGSFWTQPSGAAHITAAQAPGNVAYIEIDDGPYLVRPVEQATATAERPINMDASNVVWVDLAGQPALKIAYLWGDPSGAQPGGVFIKVPAQRASVLNNPKLRAVLILGEATVPGQPAMTPGSLLSASDGGAQVTCEGAAACVLYVRTDGGLTVSAR